MSEERLNEILAYIERDGDRFIVVWFGGSRPRDDGDRYALIPDQPYWWRQPLANSTTPGTARLCIEVAQFVNGAALAGSNARTHVCADHTVTADEGTSYCAGCERDAVRTDG